MHYPFQKKKKSSYTMDWISTGSVFASFMFLKTIPVLLPPAIYSPVQSFFLKLLRSVNRKVTILIDEFDSSIYGRNHIYEMVQSYLTSETCSRSSTLRMCMSQNSQNITYTMANNEEIEITFQGCKVTWTSFAEEQTIKGNEKRSFMLTFSEKHRQLVLKEYLDHVMKVGRDIQLSQRERRLYSNKPEDGSMLWNSTTFNHPSTFDTLALDPKLKADIKGDLTAFVHSKDYYARVGRTWKRGYLLFGPPGTGKTSLIAAIANFLEFDIYDLELTAVTDNSELKKLLVATTSKSVIVIEDVDCTIDFSSREAGRGIKSTHDGEARDSSSFISLSGVLNFADGLWSSCGGERLMIFTTNHKDKIDEALLRPGRMDKHIYMGYCEFEAFKILARNYLRIEQHQLMKEVEEGLPPAKLSPADIAEVLMGCEDDPDRGMRNVVEKIKKLRLEKEPLPGGPEEAQAAMEGVEKPAVETKVELTLF